MDHLLRPGAAAALATALAIATAVAAAAPAGATTLIRAGLEDLTAINETIVVGEVLSAESRWNDEGTFILTDVRIAALEVLKGRVGERELAVTLMGGSVGDLTTLIVGGADLVPGGSYVLFLSRADLPGAPRALTVRDHSQGAFDVLLRDGTLRAVSQANRLPLLPDVFGESGPPGGAQGLVLEEMVESVRELAGRRGGRGPEVK
jgi:hypothetical protein